MPSVVGDAEGVVCAGVVELHLGRGGGEVGEREGEREEGGRRGGGGERGGGGR